MEIVCIIWDRTEREAVSKVLTSEKQAQEPSYKGRDMNNAHSPHFITAAIVQVFLLQLSVPGRDMNNAHSSQPPTCSCSYCQYLRKSLKNPGNGCLLHESRALEGGYKPSTQQTNALDQLHFPGTGGTINNTTHMCRHCLHV